MYNTPHPHSEFDPKVTSAQRRKAIRDYCDHETKSDEDLVNFSPSNLVSTIYDLKIGDYVWINGEGRGWLDCIFIVDRISMSNLGRIGCRLLRNNLFAGWETQNNITKLSLSEIAQLKNNAKVLVENLNKFIKDA